MSIRPGLFERLANMGAHNSMCGLCCQKTTHCDKCLDQTIGGNGLDVEKWREHFRGLECRNTSSFEEWKYSAFCIELNKVLDQEFGPKKVQRDSV